MAAVNIVDFSRLFIQAAIAHGYAHETGRAKIADQFLLDLNKISAQIRTDASAIARLMQCPEWPWVRYCAAMIFMQDSKELAMNTIKELSSGDGLFVPACVALLADSQHKAQ